ncbi:1019_t:CDS:10 [Funneliformis geosporum]|uniref:4176_t:CDS:1 n=1 Tax=Funneliformis geosporum TaxID=1117311 RepID=A0A9W4WNK6_9GLOM|nr:1019_t:CDS:10 [Funneliformis geosporum]CAI2167154.1 4176_t:CDS:10 [Funneliformis geosporum]
MEVEYFNESHFSRFSSGGRTNIYGLSVFTTRLGSGLPYDREFPSNTSKCLSLEILTNNLRNRENKERIHQHLFVSSFYGVTCFVSAQGYWNTIDLPLDKDIGEIISMDVFSSINSDFVFALTTAHSGQRIIPDDDSQSQFSLRIYSLSDYALTFMEDAIFKIIGNCQSIRINFTPTQLAHTTINKEDEDCTALILCGNDGGVHLYIEEKGTKKWEEISVRPYFPFLAGFADSNSNILSLEIKEFQNIKIIAAGCQNGMLHVSISKRSESAGDFEQQEQSSVALFSPITSISIFKSSTSEKEEIHMLVTCAVEQAIVYCYVDKKLLKHPFYLRECSQHDSVLCSHIMDIDWDGQNEILVGTYGRELLVYKQGMITFQLIWQRSFMHPIYRISGLDLNEDGVEELIVATQYGVHILQPNLHKAKEQLFKVLNEIDALDKEYKELCT